MLSRPDSFFLRQRAAAGRDVQRRAAAGRGRYDTMERVPLAAALLLAFFLAEAGALPGIGLYRQRRFPQAEAALRKSLKAAPGDAEARLYLARTLVQLGRIPEALAELDRLLGPDADPETLFQAGRLVRDLAEMRYSALERLAPGSAPLLELAGRRSESRGDLTEALRLFRAAAAIEPRRPGLHFQAGSVLWKMRELDAAAAELRIELESSPYHGLANLRLGQVLAAKSDDASAAAFLERAVLAMPDSTVARRELGKSYRKLGRNSDARREWEAVAAARPDDDQVHYLLGVLYRETGEAELSRKELEKHRQILARRQAQAGSR